MCMIYVYVYICKYIQYTYIFACTYVCINTHTHTYIYIQIIYAILFILRYTCVRAYIHLGSKIFEDLLNRSMVWIVTSFTPWPSPWHRTSHDFVDLLSATAVGRGAWRHQNPFPLARLCPGKNVQP